jgi:hypothetical protein
MRSHITHPAPACTIAFFAISIILVAFLLA